MADEDRTPEQRDMLLREAQWIREDVKDARDYMDRMVGAYVIAIYAIVAWVLGKALSQPMTTENADPALWAFRTRPDVALAACAMPVINSVFSMLQMEAAVRWLGLHLLLGKQAMRLDATKPLWLWGLTVHSLKASRVWRRVLVGYITVMSGVFLVGSLWFVYPAAQRSRIVGASWWFSVGALAFSLVASFVQRVTLKRLIAADLDMD